MRGGTGEWWVKERLCRRKEHQGQGKCPHGQLEVLQTKPTSSQEDETCSLQEVAPGWAEPRASHALKQTGSTLLPCFRYLLAWVVSVRMSPSTLGEEHCLQHITTNVMSIQLSMAAAAEGGETEAAPPHSPTPLGCSSAPRSPQPPAAS